MLCPGYIAGQPRQRLSACVACRCSYSINESRTMDYWDGYIYILQATQAEAAICLRWL